MLFFFRGIFKFGFYVIILFFISLVYSSCGTDNQKEKNELPQMHFNVESQLLGNEITDMKNGVRYSPPKNWTILSDEIFNKVSEQVKSQISNNSEIVYTPVAIYANPNDNSFLSFGYVDIKENTSGYDSQIRRYADILSEQFDSSSVKSTQFLKDDIKITQYLVQKNNLVTFKLLLKGTNNKLLEFDYIVPKNNYGNEIKAIESSIGSIKLTKI